MMARWLELPLIKLLYGPRLPKDPSAHAKEFVEKIVVNLQKMNQSEVKAGLKKGEWPRVSILYSI